MDLQEDVPGVYSKMCPGSSHEGNGGIRIKSEAVSGVELLEECRPMSFPEMKAEREVSFISLCAFSGTLCTCPQVPIDLISISLPTQNSSTRMNVF
jgi:hypothetical protein